MKQYDFMGENCYETGTFTDMWGIEKTIYGGIPVSHPLADFECKEDIDNYAHWPSLDDIDYDKHIESLVTNTGRRRHMKNFSGEKRKKENSGDRRGGR